jgi:hypothetical protein
LLTVQKSRAFGLSRLEDDSEARSAAVTAAIAGRDAFEASSGLQGTARTVQHRRVENLVERELGVLYVEPAKAGAAFERTVVEHGQPEAMKRIREQPERFGALRTFAAPEPGRFAEQIDRLVRTLELKPTRESAMTLHVDASRELTASRTQARHAIEREASIRRELSGSPGTDELGRKVLGTIEKLSPKEVRQLRTTLTAPQLAVTMQLKAAMRDIVVGKEAGQEA